MYESFFGLSQRPFPSVPVPKRYFPGTAIDAARADLLRCIQRGEGPAVVIGGPGLGKTLLLLVLAEQLPQQVPSVLLSHGLIRSRKELFQTLLEALGEEQLPEDEARLQLLLRRKLTREERFHRGLALLVDEAHGLDPFLLDQLRMLTNVVRHNEPVVRLVLAGTLRLEESLSGPELESLNQRLAVRCYLESFDKAETADYIRFELAVSGGQATQVFAPDAYEAVFRLTDGVPRLINQVCDHALVLAYSRRVRPVTGALIHEAWAQLQQLPSAWTEPSPENPSPESAGAVVEFGTLDDPLPETTTTSPSTAGESESSSQEDQTPNSSQPAQQAEDSSAPEQAASQQDTSLRLSDSPARKAEDPQGKQALPDSQQQPEQHLTGESAEQETEKEAESSETGAIRAPEAQQPEHISPQGQEATASVVFGTSEPGPLASEEALTSEEASEQGEAAVATSAQQEHPETEEPAEPFVRHELDIRQTLHQLDRNWQTILEQAQQETQTDAPSADAQVGSASAQFEEETIEDLYAALDAQSLSTPSAQDHPRTQTVSAASELLHCDESPEDASSEGLSQRTASGRTIAKEPTEPVRLKLEPPEAASPGEEIQVQVHPDRVEVVVDPYAPLISASQAESSQPQGLSGTHQPDSAEGPDLAVQAPEEQNLPASAVEVSAGEGVLLIEEEGQTESEEPATASAEQDVEVVPRQQWPEAFRQLHGPQQS